MPVSSISRSAVSPSAFRRTSTRPPFGVNLSAFETRLSSICASRAAIAVELPDAADVCGQHDPLRVRDRRGGLDALVHDQTEIDGLALDRELARLDLGEEEQVAHELEQPLRVPLDDLEVAPAPGLGRLEVLEQQLDVAADRGQRRAQLVGDERDELVLEPVELAEPVVLLGEEALDGLGFRTGRALGVEQPAAFLGELA